MTSGLIARVPINEFTEFHPSNANYWRAIVLFGRNVASYKFALAKSLLELGQAQQEFVSLEELAKVFASHIVTHLAEAEKQITSSSSKFLDACKAFAGGEISEDELLSKTVKFGFANVIDAFHIVNHAEIPVRFFSDERTGPRKGIRLHDQCLDLATGAQQSNLQHEVEARWRLVETAWRLNITRNLMKIEYDELGKLLFVTDPALRRTNITSCRDALNGYQKGKCFYCFSDIRLCDNDGGELPDVDHFFPHTLKRVEVESLFDGVWNLVLACKSCNRGPAGKFARVPSLKLLERLNRRNEFLIGSHHPLRETLIRQTGLSAGDRIGFLRERHQKATENLIHFWEPFADLEPAF